MGWKEASLLNQVILTALHSRQRETKIHLAAVALVIVAATCLRLRYLTQPIRYDEAWSFNTYASVPFGLGLFRYYSTNNHVLNTAFMHVSYLVFGNHPWSLRLSAFISGILLVPASYVAVRMFYDRHVALLCAGLIAVSSPLIEYSTNARGYSLMCLITMLLFALAIHLKDSADRAGWVLFTILAAFGFLTVPTMSYPYGAIVTWLILSALVKDTALPRGRFLRILILSSLATVALTTFLYLPIFILSGPASVFQGPYVTPMPLGFVVANLPKRLHQIWAQWHRDIPNWMRAVLAFGVLVSLLFHRHVTRHRASPVVALVLGCISLVFVLRLLPFLRMWIFAIPFYSAAASAGLLFLLRSAGVTAERKLEYTCATLALVLVLFMANNVVRSDSVYYSGETGVLRNGEQIVLVLKQNLQSGDRVVFEIPSGQPLRYYFGLHGIPLDHLNQDARTSRRLWIVVNQPVKFWQNEKPQSVEGILATTDIVASEWAPPVKISEFPEATLYLSERVAVLTKAPPPPGITPTRWPGGPVAPAPDDRWLVVPTGRSDTHRPFNGTLVHDGWVGAAAGVWAIPDVSSGAGKR